MCRFESGVVVYKGGDIEILTHPRESSHSAIRKHHNLRDSGELADRNSCPVELYPVTDLFDYVTWKFEFDAGKPDWWEDWMEEKCRRVLSSSAKRKLEEKTFAGDLDLNSLTSLPEGVSLKAGKNLYLNSLISLPEGVSLEAGGYLDLRSLTSLPKGVSLEAGGNLYLNFLISLPEGVSLKAEGDLDLRSLTSLPEGVSLKVGGNLYLRSLTSLPEGVSLEAGGYLNLSSLTSLPEGVSLEAKSVYDGNSWMTAAQYREKHTT